LQASFIDQRMPGCCLMLSCRAVRPREPGTFCCQLPCLGSARCCVVWGHVMVTPAHARLAPPGAAPTAGAARAGHLPARAYIQRERRAGQAALPRAHRQEPARRHARPGDPHQGAPRPRRARAAPSGPVRLCDLVHRTRLAIVRRLEAGRSGGADNRDGLSAGGASGARRRARRWTRRSGRWRSGTRASA